MPARADTLSKQLILQKKGLARRAKRCHDGAKLCSIRDQHFLQVLRQLDASEELLCSWLEIQDFPLLPFDPLVGPQCPECIDFSLIAWPRRAPWKKKGLILHRLRLQPLLQRPLEDWLRRPRGPRGFLLPLPFLAFLHCTHCAHHALIGLQHLFSCHQVRCCLISGGHGWSRGHVHHHANYWNQHNDFGRLPQHCPLFEPKA
mmetsp:Transcript_47499/g.111085  ORF Transcript_47499/g.111085 Transcript_47499/m.111085 type:complete len:202 (-) Transcript_47499:3-608(-)